MEGKVKMNIFNWIFLTCMFFTPFYTYYMAVIVQHSQKPFPNPTITGTACHHPQDTPFRFIMLIATSFLSIIFFTMFRWIQKIAARVQYPYKLSKWEFYLAQFSIFTYAVTIGTIDTKNTGPLHGPCAVIFFVIWMYTIIHITLFLTDLRKWDSSVMSRNSLLLKQLLAFYVSCIWIYCIYFLITVSQQENGKSDKYVAILEWNSVFINILWTLSFVTEWKYFNLCLTKKL